MSTQEQRERFEAWYQSDRDWYVTKLGAREATRIMSIVTNDELVQVTGGLRQGAAQCRWIERNLGFKPPRKADGHPLLTWEQINRTPSEPIGKPQPKWKNAA